MTRDDLIGRLLSLPALIEAQERALLAASERLAECKYEREWRKAELLLREDTPVSGRNGETREAQLLQMLQGEDASVVRAEQQVARERITLSRLVNDFRSARLLLGLVTAETRALADAEELVEER